MFISRALILHNPPIPLKNTLYTFHPLVTAPRPLLVSQPCRLASNEGGKGLISLAALSIRVRMCPQSIDKNEYPPFKFGRRISSSFVRVCETLTIGARGRSRENSPDTFKQRSATIFFRFLGNDQAFVLAPSRIHPILPPVPDSLNIYAN